MKKKLPVGRPPMEDTIKVSSRYVLRLSLEEKAIVLAHLSKYEDMLNRQGISISEYIRTLMPGINKNTLAEALNNRSARKDTWSFFCNDQDWEKLSALAAEFSISKNDLLIRIALSGNTTRLLKE